MLLIINRLRLYYCTNTILFTTIFNFFSFNNSIDNFVHSFCGNQLSRSTIDSSNTYSFIISSSTKQICLVFILQPRYQYKRVLHCRLFLELSLQIPIYHQQHLEFVHLQLNVGLQSLVQFPIAYS